MRIFGSINNKYSMGIIKFNMKSPNLIQNIYLYYINIFIEYFFNTIYIHTP